MFFFSSRRSAESNDAKQAQEAKEEEKEKDECEDDPPVQGPLPYEPDDAPWKKTSERSGVRKL